MAKRINSGYMSGYFNHGSLHVRDMNPPQGHERPREIDADTNVCLTCNRPADRCTGKCKAVRGRKVKHE